MLEVQMKQPMMFKSFNNEGPLVVPIGVFLSNFFTRNTKLCPITTIKFTDQKESKVFSDKAGDYGKISSEKVEFDFSKVFNQMPDKT